MIIVRRFSYANVMSTLAVFLALGGAAYAVAKIDGGDLEKHSVKGNKLVNNTIKGKQVNESKLGKVPSAVHADTADTATNATNATNAANADTLDNLDSLDFEKSTTVLDGNGAINSTNAQGLFNLLDVGASVSTDGDADIFTQLRLTNNNGSGNLIGRPFTSAGPGPAFGVAANTAQSIGPASGNGTDFMDVLITDAGNPAKAAWVHCLYNFTAGVPTVWCWGITK